MAARSANLLYPWFDGITYAQLVEEDQSRAVADLMSKLEQQNRWKKIGIENDSADPLKGSADDFKDDVLFLLFTALYFSGWEST